MPAWAVTTKFNANDQSMNAMWKRQNANARKFGKTSENSFKRAGKAGSKFSTGMKSVLAAGLFVGIGSRIVDIGKKAIGLASDLTEVQNVVDVTFGAMKADINSFSKTALKQFGLSELQAKQFAGTFGALIKSSGVSEQSMLKMSKGLTGLTGDFASFYNLPHDVAFQKLRAGISGETEPLKQLGINMSVANLQAFALTKGITKKWKTMDQAAQVQLRYNFLMAKSKDAQGDFNRTLKTSYANQKRVLSTKFDQALAKIATKILPMLTDAFAFMNKQMGKIDTDALGRGFLAFGKGVKFVIKTFIKLIPILKIAIGLFIWYKATLIATALIQKGQAGVEMIRFISSLGGFSRAVLLATAKQWLLNAALLANPFGLVAIAVAAFGALIYHVYKNFDQYVLIMQLRITELTFKFQHLRFELYKVLNAIGLVSNEKLGKAAFEAKMTYIKGKTEALQLKKLEQQKDKAPNSAEVKAKATVNGKIDVNVNAPKGTTVDSKSGTKGVDLKSMGVNP